MRISFSKLPFNEYVKTQRRYWLDRKRLFAMMKKGYAPLNFDADSKKQARMTARKLKERYGNCTILFRKSSSRRGYHFTVFKDGKQLFLKIKDALRERRRCMDCYGRLRADEVRARHGLSISILFDSKNFKSATQWRELKSLSQLDSRSTRGKSAPRSRSIP
jgi:hypothetical protein